MVPAVTIVATALTQAGDPYVWAVENDPNDPDPDAHDCSELVQWDCGFNGVTPTVPDGSWIQYRHCFNHGTACTVTNAVTTAGALLFRFSADPLKGARPASSHVAISLGNGYTIEARGTAYGVGVFNADPTVRGWTHAALIPGVDYMTFEYTPPSDLTDEQGEVFYTAWQLAWELGLVNEHTEPTDIVEKQEMIAFLTRFYTKITKPLEEEIARLSAGALPESFDATITPYPVD